MDILLANIAPKNQELASGSAHYAVGTHYVTPNEGSPKWRQGVILSLIIHLSLLTGLCALGKDLEPQAVIYHVSLAGMPQGTSPHKGSGESPENPPLPSKKTGPDPVTAAPVQAQATPSADFQTAPNPRYKKTSKPPKARHNNSVQAGAGQKAAVASTSFPEQAAVSGQASAEARPETASEAHLTTKEYGEKNGEGAESREAGGVKGHNAGTSPAAGQGGEGNVFTQDQVDTMPTITRRATPIYPPEAKKHQVQGRVVVSLVVDRSGKGTQCTIHSAAPQGYFEASALEAVSRMRFAPGKKGGRAINALVLLPFDFRLR